MCETTTGRLDRAAVHRISQDWRCWAAPAKSIRPYLIAKKENLTFTSQLAVWTGRAHLSNGVGRVDVRSRGIYR